jgi:hypothetical protein
MPEKPNKCRSKKSGSKAKAFAIAWWMDLGCACVCCLCRCVFLVLPPFCGATSVLSRITCWWVVGVLWLERPYVHLRGHVVPCLRSSPLVYWVVVWLPLMAMFITVFTLAFSKDMPRFQSVGTFLNSRSTYVITIWKSLLFFFGIFQIKSLKQAYKGANYTGGPTTCSSCEGLDLDLAKRVITVQQPVNHVKIWSSINRKMTCGIIFFAKYP